MSHYIAHQIILNNGLYNLAKCRSKRDRLIIVTRFGSPFLYSSITDAYFQTMGKTENLLDDAKRTDIGANLVQNTEGTITGTAERVCLGLHTAAKTAAREKSTFI